MSTPDWELMVQAKTTTKLKTSLCDPTLSALALQVRKYLSFKKEII